MIISASLQNLTILEHQMDLLKKKLKVSVVQNPTLLVWRI